MTLAPGTRVGIYEILGPIGAGGMGEVYRARDTKLKRDVALKVLPDSFAQDADRMARFQREAEVLASLNHPNIAAIYGVEERALVMELIEGENLKGPLPIETVIEYASQIALGLEAAHDKGIVHRDLKPANIRVTPSGVVKILDFGLAAVAQASTSDSNPANSPTLTLRATEAGFIMGTAAYMSPEQAAAKPVDHRADIWSFGVVLWEMLTGKPLFEGETVSHILAAVLTKDPDWTLLPSSTPKNVRLVLRRCLERDLKRRLRDIGDAWIELNTVEEPVPAQAEVKRPGVSRWIPWLAAGALAIAAIGFAFLRKSPQPGPVIRWAYTQESPFGMPAISHDGSRVVYSEFASGTIRLVMRTLNQVGSRVIPGTETGGVPGFSPDDQSIAYFAGFSGGTVGSRLQTLDLNGGAPTVLCECTVGMGISWGDDGNIVYSDGKALLRVPSTGGAAQPLISPDATKGQLAYVSPFVLPGARAILFTIDTASGDGQVALLDLKDGKYRVLVNGRNPQYISAGWLTFYRSGSLYGVPFNLKGLATTGSERPLIDDLSGVQSAEAGEYSVSRGGILVYMSGRNEGGKTVLAWVDRNGIVQPISEPQQWGNGRLSPDGRYIANSMQGAGKTDDIWLLDAERRTPVRLTFGGVNRYPTWTPDGRRIAYYSSGAGKTGLYWIASDGSGKPELLLETMASAVPSSFTPDGKNLLFSQISDGKLQHIWTLRVGAGVDQPKPVLLHDTPFSEGNGQVSPDGKYIAYASIESGAGDIYVQPFPGPGPKVRISVQGGTTPRWSPSGRELFFWTRGRDSLMAVDVRPGATFEASVPHLVLKMFAGTTWDIAPDGKKFLVETFQSGSSLKLVTVVNWFNELPRAK